MPAARSSVFRLITSRKHLALDLVTSYGVSFVRAGAMLAIIALLSRRTPAAYLAAFLFLRSVLGLLANLFAGAQPAALAALRCKPVPSAEAVATPIEQEQIESQSDAAVTPTLDYRSRQPAIVAAPPPAGFGALFVASALPALLMYLLVCLSVPWLRDALATVLPPSRSWTVSAFVTAFAAGFLFRLHSDTAGGVLQSRKLLWLDNLLVAAAEILWVASVAMVTSRLWRNEFVAIGTAYFYSGMLLWIARWLIAGVLLIDTRRFTWAGRFDMARRYLGVLGILAIASAGDFLYGGANNLIINRWLDPLLAADYNPALQIDALLLLAVAAISSVLLPRAVAMHEAGQFAALRRAYLGATAIGMLLLACGAGLFLAFQKPLLKLWLADVPAGTVAILPLVLAHCVLGGTGSIARAILVGIGRFKSYTAVALGAGLLNAALGVLFVLGFGWGLRSIVCATIISVSLRVLIVFPILIFHALRQDERRFLASRPRSR